MAASLVFYGYYNWYYLTIICVSIFVNYFIVKSIGGALGIEEAF